MGGGGGRCGRGVGWRGARSRGARFVRRKARAWRVRMVARHSRGRIRVRAVGMAVGGHRHGHPGLPRVGGGVGHRNLATICLHRGGGAVAVFDGQELLRRHRHHRRSHRGGVGEEARVILQPHALGRVWQGGEPVALAHERLAPQLQVGDEGALGHAQPDVAVHDPLGGDLPPLQCGGL